MIMSQQKVKICQILHLTHIRLTQIQKKGLNKIAQTLFINLAN